jgi:RimJ/RimL family protein N-acetyltransferase/predicted nucleotidyltransferase
MSEAGAVWDKIIPAHLPCLREMTPQDVERHILWVERGRSEGVFRPSTVLTVSDLLQYQEDMKREGWTYRCFVVEYEDAAIGYVDYRFRSGVGEILGLYLEKSLRGRGLGRYVIRWATASLRSQRCREIVVEVYADNKASLNACRAGGFRRHVPSDRLEDSRALWCLKRRCATLTRLSPPQPLYSQLRGQNLYLTHAAIADALVDRARRVPQVEVVLGMGSLARGFADQWSDLDLAILGRRLDPKDFWRGERYFGEVSVDLFLVDLNFTPPARWDRARRQAFEESVVLFRREKSSLECLRRVRLGKRERLRGMQELLFHLGWIGFAPRSWFGQTRYGYVWGVPPDVWLQRGSLAAAHETVSRAFEMILQLLYLINFQHIPDPKWRLYLAPGLPWLPSRFEELAACLSSDVRDEAGFRRRSDAALSLIDAAVDRMESRREIEGDWYEAYLQFCRDYDHRK